MQYSNTLPGDLRNGSQPRKSLFSAFVASLRFNHSSSLRCRAATLLRIAPAVLMLAAGNLVHAAPLGTIFTYQGELYDSVGRANGRYDLTFALFNDPVVGAQIGTTWTNLNVAVSNGLFTTTVDFGSGIFDGTAYWLAIGVRSNGSGVVFSTLTPRQAVTPSPYALYATTAPIADNAVTSAKILDGTIAAADLGPNSVNSTHIVNGQVLNADLGANAVDSSKVLDGSLVGADLANNTVTSAQLADAVALGGAATVGQLDVYKTTAGGPAISLFGTGTGGYQYLYQDDGQIGIYLDGDSGGGGLQYLYAADGSVGVALDGESGGAGLISIYNTNSSARILLDGAGSGSGGQITVYAQDGSSTVQVFGESSGAGLINVNNNVSSPRVVIDGEGNGAGGQINLYAGDGSNGITLYGDSGGGGLEYLYSADGSLGVYLDGDSGGGGLISILNTNGSSRILLDGASLNGGGEASIYDSTGTETIELLGAASGTFGGKITTRQGDGTVAVEIISEAYAGDGGLISIKNAAGTERLELDGDDGDGAAAVRLHDTTGATTILLDADYSGGGARVGIGRTPSANALEVNGNASKTTAGSWLANSDGRIKTDVRPVTQALARLEQVQPVAFRYTADYRAQHPEIEDHDYLNVVAQDFQKVFPDWVKSGGDTLPSGEKILQVDTYPLTIYSAAAIQELSQDLRKKQAEIDELRQTVNELKKLVNGLNRKL